MISRRTFLRAGLLLGGAMLADGFVIEPRRLDLQKIAVKINGLTPEFDGFTICQITDVHHSPLVSLEYIKSIVEKANGLKPDLTVLTGDYIDEDKDYMAPSVKALSGLRARHGAVSILGNHDYYAGKGYAEDVFASNRMRLLKDSHMLIGSGKSALCIAGTSDYLEGRPDAKRALSGVDPEVPRILLSHHPDYSEYLPPDERIDLVLSGHTHGGQVRLPFAIAPVMPSEFGQKYSGGLVANKNTQVYVSRGVGVVMIPVRFNCPPELTFIRLVA